MLWEKLLIATICFLGYFAFAFGIKAMTKRKELSLETMFWIGVGYLVMLSSLMPKR